MHLTKPLRARELLEKKHAEAELLKKTEEQRKEIERRNLGKQMTEAKVSSNLFLLFSVHFLESLNSIHFLCKLFAVFKRWRLVR